METPEKRYDYNEAHYWASTLVEQLAPSCNQITIAGSIRRRKPTVKDIEIVCVPKMEYARKPDAGLFSETEYTRVRGFTYTVESWNVEKGQPATGKYVKCQPWPDAYPINVDLFIANPDNWGYILAIRTGSSEFNQGLIKRWKMMGYEGREGYLWSGDERIAVPTEARLFELLNMRYVEPAERHLFPDARKVIAR